MANSLATIDHGRMCQWAERRGATPARVKGAQVIQLGFPGYTGEETLQHVVWDVWFRIFEERNLALVFQERIATRS